MDFQEAVLIYSLLAKKNGGSVIYSLLAKESVT